MAKPKITIIGLGVTGASMGLALQREETDFEIVGHDKTQEATANARKLGAVNRTDWNLHSACEDADLVITAVPLLELDELYSQIAEDLKPGSMVLGVVSLMEPALTVAARHIPEQAHFVAGHPVLTGVGGTLTMRADLFQDVVFSLAGGVNTDPSALQLASDFIDRIGATPLFVDATEHDGIMAEVEQLPRVLAAALMRVSSSAPGWREARRLAGRQFAQSTELGGSADQLYSSLRANQEQVLVRLRQIQQELAEWMEMLREEPEEGEPDALLNALKDVEAERIDWEVHAELKNWEEGSPAVERRDKEESGMLRQMFFGNMFGRRPPRGNP
jgi:prephenate dehydrogenase